MRSTSGKTIPMRNTPMDCGPVENIHGSHTMSLESQRSNAPEKTRFSLIAYYIRKMYRIHHRASKTPKNFSRPPGTPLYYFLQLNLRFFSQSMLACMLLYGVLISRILNLKYRFLSIINFPIYMYEYKVIISGIKCMLV